MAYLAALVSVLEEVKLLCHVKHQIGDLASPAADSPLVDNFTVDNHLRMLSLSGSSSPVQAGPSTSPQAANMKDLPVNQRQKSLEVVDQSAMSAGQKLVRSPGNGQAGQTGSTKSSIRLKKRTMCLPARPTSQTSTLPARSEAGSGDTVDSEFVEARDTPHLEAHPQERASVSNDNNILLDPDVLTDHVTQVEY